MTTRRSFLSLLGLAPVAAPAIAEELAKPQFATGGFVRLRTEPPHYFLPLRRALPGDKDGWLKFNRFDHLLGANNNTPSIRASRKRLPGLPERISRERAKSVRRS